MLWKRHFTQFSYLQVDLIAAGRLIDQNAAAATTWCGRRWKTRWSPRRRPTVTWSYGIYSAPAAPSRSRSTQTTSALSTRSEGFLSLHDQCHMLCQICSWLQVKHTVPRRGHLALKSVRLLIFTNRRDLSSVAETDEDLDKMGIIWWVTRNR